MDAIGTILHEIITDMEGITSVDDIVDDSNYKPIAKAFEEKVLT